MVLVSEKQHELQLPMAYFEANNDIPTMLRFCLKNGSKDPTLWTQTLNILASWVSGSQSVLCVLGCSRSLLLPPPGECIQNIGIRIGAEWCDFLWSCRQRGTERQIREVLMHIEVIRIYIRFLTRNAPWRLSDRRDAQ